MSETDKHRAVGTYDTGSCIHTVSLKATCVVCDRMVGVNTEPPEQRNRLPRPMGRDPIRWPSHYNQGDIECIDAMVAAFGTEAVKSYCRVNAFKYLWRSLEKGNPEADLKKAIWYLRFSMSDDPRDDDRKTP